MNAEEIIEELRLLSENDEWVFAADITDEAADIIESLQAQLKLEHGGALAAAENCLRLQGEVNDLQARLAEAKRRAEKAVEDLNALRKKSGWKCFACKYDTNYVREICAGCDYNNGNNWRWRGDAEDGENETTVAYFTLCKDNELGYVYKCASCGNEMYGYIPKYCSECGKRIVEGDAE